MTRAVLLSIVALMVCGTQCPNIPWPVCTLEFVYGVQVELTDAETGEPVSDATLVLTEGTYTETMEEIMPGQYVGAGERKGTYDLTVEAEGYNSESRSGIEVDADLCHVIPVRLEIELTPSP